MLRSRSHQTWFSVIAALLSCAVQALQLAAQEESKPPEFILRGRVVDRNDKPVKDAEVRFSGYVAPGKLGAEKAKTDFVGRFHLVIGAEPQFLNSGASLEAVNPNQDAIAYVRFPEEMAEQFLENEITIRLKPIRKIRLRVVDETGAPIAGAKTAAQLAYPRVGYAQTNDAGIAEIALPEKERILTIVAWKDGKGLDYRSFELSREQRGVVGAQPPEFPASGEATLALEGTQPFEMRVIDEDQKPIPQVQTYGWLLKKESEVNYLNLSYFQSAFVELTDDEGVSRFRWVPKWHQTMMVPHAYSPLYESPRIEYEPTKGNGRVEAKLIKKVRVSGQVVHADGKPANRILVRASNDGGIREMTYTNADGGFEFFICPVNNLFITVEDKKWVAASLSGFAIEKDKPRELPKLVLRTATRLHGVLLDQDSGMPAGGIDIYLVQIGRPPVKFDGQINSDAEDPWDLGGIRHSRRIETNAQGEFEFHVEPGFYLLGASPLKLTDYQKLEIKDEPTVVANLKSEIRRRGLFTGKVVNKADGKPVEDAVVESTSNFTIGWKTKTDAEGKYAVERNGEPYLIWAFSKDGELGGFSEINAKQKESTLELLPLGKVKGKVLDRATGKPLAKAKVHYNSLIWDKTRGMGSTAFGGSAVTDDDGNFTFQKVIQEREYQIHIEEGRSSVRTFTLHSAETLDLGNLLE